MPRRPTIRVGEGPDQRRSRPSRRVLAAGTPQPLRPHRAGLLPLPRTQAHQPGRAGPRRRRPLGDRGNLPNREGADRPGPLLGAPIHRLVPACHALDARPRIPDRHTVEKGAPNADGELVTLSLPEIRHLLVALVLHQPADPGHVLRRSHWSRRHQHIARRHHYQRRGHS